MAETEAGAAVLEVPATEPETPSKETTETAPPEIDWKARAEKAEGERAQALAEKEQALQRAKSAEGRARTPEQIEALAAQVKSLRREIRRDKIEADADLQPEQRKARLKELTDEEQADAAKAQEVKEAAKVLNYATKLAARINKKMTRAGVTKDTPAVKEAQAKWLEAASEDEYDDIYEKLDDFLDVEIEGKAEKALTEARQRANREAGTLAVGAKGGTGGSSGLSGRELEKAVAAGTVAMTPAVQKKLSDYWNQ